MLCLYSMCCLHTDIPTPRFCGFGHCPLYIPLHFGNVLTLSMSSMWWQLRSTTGSTTSALLLHNSIYVGQQIGQPTSLLQQNSHTGFCSFPLSHSVMSQSNVTLGSDPVFTGFGRVYCPISDTKQYVAQHMLGGS